MSKKKSNIVPFRLVSISTEEFATFRENHDSQSQEFDIGVGIDIKLNAENYQLGLFTRFNFNQSESTVLTLTCACHFEIEQEFWNDNIKDDKLVFPAEFITHLLVLVVGTSRGIIHSKKPHWLGDVLLPTINVSKMIDSDISFELV